MTARQAPYRVAARRPPDHRRPADLLLLVAVVVQAAAVGLWPRVVTVDGPAHLAGAAALLRVGEGVHALYEVNPTVVPNALATLLLAGLLPLLGPDGAERLLVLGYVVGLPLAARYALRGVDPRAGWLALGAVPFGAGYLHAYGFYNLQLALVGLLVVAGVGLRQRAGWSARSAVTAGLLLVLTWAAHLLPLIVAGLLLSVLALCRSWAERRDLRGAVRRHLLPTVLLGLPVAALTAHFLLATAASRGEPVRVGSPGGLLVGLLSLTRPLVAWTTWEYAGSGLVAAGLLVLAVAQARRGSRGPERTALALTALLVTVWYLVSPDRYGPAYGFLNDRLSLFPPLLLLLWVAAPPPSARVTRLAAAALLAGTLGLVAARLPTDVAHQRDVAELLSVAPQVPRGSTLVELRLVRVGPVGPDARNRSRDPLRHESGRIAALRDAVDVGHYEAVTPYFPVRWRPGTDPRRAIDPSLTGLPRVPPVADLERGPQVVLLVGRTRADDAVLRRAGTVRLLEQLERTYRRTAVSGRSGLVELWVRR